MLRSPDGSYEVSWCPKHQLPQALEAFKEQIYSGSEVDDSLSLTETIGDLFTGLTRLGLIYETEPFQPIGSWFSDIKIDGVQNYKYVTIYGLSGKNPNKWAQGLAKLVENWAQQEGCHSYRWYGRLGWTRYETDIKLLEVVNDREGLFEKVIAA